MSFSCSIFRTLATVLIVHIILCKFKGSRTSVTLTFLASTGHLVFGYWTKFGSGEELDLYIFDWTVPHCVLTLRLIAVAFDLLDGTVTKPKPRQKVKNSSEGEEGTFKSKEKDEPKTGSNQDRIEDVPTLLQLLSHSYFPPSFLVGPQFSIKHTIAFVEDVENEKVLMSVWSHAVGRIVGSLSYLVILLIGSLHFPSEYLLSVEFNTLPLIWRLVYFTITVRIQFYRYFFFFLLSEANCILYGVNFDRNKNAICFKLCSNVDPIAFDFTGISFLTSFNQGYNTCTNRWIGKYVFHRLPFIKLPPTSISGSKVVQVFENCVNHKFTRFFISSMFVCLWHGFHPGYFFTFSYIPINYIIEWDFLHHYWPSIRRAFNVQSFQEFKPSIKIPLYILLRIYCMFSLSNAYVSMLFLSFDRFIAIFKSIFFIQHFLFLSYIIIRISLIIIK